MILPKHMRACIIAAALAVPCGAASAAASLTVTIDEAKLVALKGQAAEIILGNPSIADVAVQSSRQIVVTGKSFGRTNLIVLDAAGKEILNTSLSVDDNPKGIVTLRKGSASVTYYCAPNCGSTLAIGDSSDYFSATSGQIQSKQTISRSAAEGGNAQ